MSNNSDAEPCALVSEAFDCFNRKDSNGLIEKMSTNFSVFGLGGGPLREGKPTVEELDERYAAGMSPDVHPSDLKATIYDDIAVVTCYLHGSIRQPDGDIWQGPYRYSAVLAIPDGKWQIVHDHGSPLLVDPKMKQ